MGAKNLDFSKIRGHRAVVFDGNGPVTKVTSASPTYMRFDVTVTGLAAHAGVEPEKGLSAIKILAEIIAKLPHGRIDSDTTVNIGTITGGSVRNTVPDKASFTGEFRSRSLESIELLKLQITNILESTRSQYKEAVIEEDIGLEFQMYQLNDNNPMVTLVVSTLFELGLKPEIEPSGGGTDANVFNLNNIQSVVVGMSTQEMHTTREYVEISDLVDTARFCEALIGREKH
jgi:tripeptide aminopeptidase